jgi:hypothetical protein
LTVTFREAAGPTHYVSPGYFPGVYDQTRAQPVRVSAGEELQGIDFATVLTPLLSVSGRVLSAEGQAAPSHCTVVLRPREGGAERQAPCNPESGEFALGEVPPGAYRLLAYAAETATIGSAARDVELKADELTGVTLPLDQPFATQGHVDFRGASGRVSLELVPVASQVAASTPVAVDESGGFQFPLVLRERYHLRLATQNPRLYISRVRVAGKAARGTLIDMSGNPGERIAVELGIDGGIVTGHVEGPVELSRFPGQAVVLVPAEPARREGSQLQVALTQNGVFRFANAPPGEYILYAFPLSDGPAGGDPLALTNPGWVETYQGQGARVTVASNSESSADVPLQALP